MQQHPFHDDAELAEILGSTITQRTTMLTIGRLTEAARQWFPAGAPIYDSQMVQLARQLEN